MSNYNYDRFGAVRSAAAGSIEDPSTTNTNNSSGDNMGLYPPPQTSRPLSTQQLSLVRSLPLNNSCVECETPSPDWASVTYGIALCLECAGVHRGLGVHLSFVRSLTMDDWTDDQYRRMVQGGNGKWKDYWNLHGGKDKVSIEVNGSGDVVDKDALRRKIRLEYESNAARAYREALSLNAKACRSRNDPSTLRSASTEFAPAPQFEGDAVVLAEEYPPSLQELLQTQAWPFALGLISSGKSTFVLLAWVALGISGAYGIRWWGCNKLEAIQVITSSLPSLNPVAQGYMGASTVSDGCSSTFNMIAMGVLTLTAGIPYFLLRRFALKIATSLLVNREDAFKSAKNLLMDRISMGRAQRLKRCDVYYPAVAEGNELRAKYGLIFYPGALVDRTAYAPIATRMSELGILVAVANLEPYRLISNLTNYPIREEMMHILSDSVLLSKQGSWTVDKWAIGGHSMGGHVAIAVVANELSSTVKKVVLWGVSSYPDASWFPCKRTLRKIPDMDVILINGSNDEIVGNVTKYYSNAERDFEKKMPPRIQFGSLTKKDRGYTHHLTIEGGNHSGCAHYGPQTNPRPDGVRSITLEQQQRRMAEATTDFLLGGTTKRD